MGWNQAVHLRVRGCVVVRSSNNLCVDQDGKALKDSLVQKTGRVKVFVFPKSVSAPALADWPHYRTQRGH